MAIDPWMQDAAAGTPSYTAQEIRLATVTPFAAGVGVSLGVRSGVRNSGSDTDLLVSAQAAPNMTVKVNPGVCVVQSATAGQGAYTWALTATKTLTIGAAHATLTRTDLIAVRIRDDNVDGSGAQDGDVVVVAGTPGSSAPALPSGASYMEIGRVTVAASVASITAGAVTDRRPFYASPGGIVAATAVTEPAAGSVAPHQYVYRTDLNGGVLRRSDGGAYRMAAPYRARTVLAAPSGPVTFSGLSGLDTIIIRTHACSDYAADAFPLYLRIDGSASTVYAGQYVEVAGTTGGYVEVDGQRYGTSDGADNARIIALLQQIAERVSGGGKTYSLTVNTSADHEPIVDDFAIMEAQSGSGL